MPDGETQQPNNQWRKYAWTWTVNTGKKPLSGVDHICQSIVDILTTPLETRVMLPEYGTQLFDLLIIP